LAGENSGDEVRQVYQVIKFVPLSPVLSYSPELIIAKAAAGHRRIMLFGESGTGKSTLAAGLARALSEAGVCCTCIGADPGSPAFGPPGAVCIGRWEMDSWKIITLEALCTLDAGRFRLPLVSAIRRLAGMIGQEQVLVDAPGIVRSVAGAELLTGLVEASGVTHVLVLTHRDHNQPLVHELAATGCDVTFMYPSPLAREPGKNKRARHRTGMWNAYLHNAIERTLMLAEMPLTGTPPPAGHLEHLLGRQIAFLKGGKTLTMGEILFVEGGAVRVRAADTDGEEDQFLVRDAWRNTRGLLVTFKPSAGPTICIPPDIAPYQDVEKNPGPRPVVRIGEATGILVNGVFGDPLLHLRFHNRKRSILFDLGEGNRLPARLAHQVSDVLISHAHIDHISGFYWLMRCRIGMPEPCRIYGPPGLAGHIAGLISGILWDRIGEGGPRFEIGELREDRLHLFRVQAGRKRIEKIGERPASGGGLFTDQDCSVRAVTLAHGGSPVLAYSLEQAVKYNVRKNRLIERNLAPGHWLGELKKNIAAGKRDAPVRIPDGENGTAGSLADDLLLFTPAQKLVYATDLSDTDANREKLTGLSQKAQILFCEAAFVESDRRYAEMNGHLTARSCGEVANAARVELLVPFHFSRRYEKNPMRIYDEAGEMFTNVKKF